MIARAAIVGAALLLAVAPAGAQVVIDPPLQAKETVRRSVARVDDLPKPTAPKPPRRLRPPGAPLSDALADLGQSWQGLFHDGLARPFTRNGMLPAFAEPPPLAPIVLSTFAGGSTDGALIAGTSWVGNVTQGAGQLAVGGTARDDNGWRATGLSVDATGLLYLNITAQRLAGHAAETLFVQFEDRFLNTRIFSVSTSVFGTDGPTLAQITLGPWGAGFDRTQIAGWNIGGGSVGTVDFRMTFDHLELTATAIPEPASVAAALGAGVLAVAIVRRRRRRSHPVTNG